VFVAEDKPDQGDAEAVKIWKTRKRTLQKLILEEFDKEEYEDLILGKEKKEEEAPATPPSESPASPEEIPPGSPTGPSPMVTPGARIKGLMAKIPLLNRIVK